ncbi:DUF4097 family beta strand repeat-containing protein [Pseudonocardia endophytica]|uniref:Putative adhesin n=1 Tax=Pseudonocardia endophytica TaxID=401976 RepID=A0A4R1HK88_PSEEN|nr:DUF4097 family beta strand repeat-containing protein [Pseudonocardia endophytica]TCK21441.1 putative adhesin [Pseudonocardia endophytica]
MSTFDTPGPITATVELPIGELHVVASDRTDTVVDVRSNAEDRKQAEDVRVELVGDELRVTGPTLGLLQKLTPKTPGRSLEVEIALPAGSSLTARSGYGGIRAEGRLGACAVHTKYGDVRIDDARSATLSVGYGLVRVNGTVDGDADLTADHGGVQVKRVGGAASIRSKHGAIHADEIGGDAQLTGGYGDIDIDDAQSDVRVRTTYGNVRLGRVARGEVSLTNSHGRMDVGIAGTSAAWLDVDTTGRFSNDLSPRDDPDGFAETVSVHARSQDGAIVIRRA